MEFVAVQRPGCELAVVRRPGGAAAAGSAVFVHGLGDAASAFAPALEAAPLRPFEVVLLDLLGHGASDKPDAFDYRPASHAAVLFQALRTLAPPPPVHLVGYSLGAAVAVELARLPLGGRGALVLVEPALDPGRMDFAARVAAVPEADFAARFGEFLAPCASEEASAADRLWAETAAFASAVAFHRSARGLLEAARRGEPLAHLRELVGPKALLLSQPAARDLPLAREMRREGVPVAALEAPGGMPMYECPEAFYAAVAAACAQPYSSARKGSG